MSSTNNQIIPLLSGVLLFILCLLYVSPSSATGPRVTPSLFVEDRNEIYALDYPPYVSNDIEGGGLNVALIKAAMQAANLEALITPLPLQKMVRYYLQQEDAIAVLSRQLNLVDAEHLIAIPLSLNDQYYYYLRNNKKIPTDWQGEVAGLEGLSYGAYRGEVLDAYKEQGVDVAYGRPRTLVKKLLAGKVDFVRLPAITMQWLMEKKFSNEQANIVATGRLPQQLDFIVFNTRHPRGKVAAQDFIQGLNIIIKNGRYDAILQRYIDSDATRRDNLESLQQRLGVLKLK